MFKKYPKIHRLGTEETEGILDGKCHVQEKIDGANASIWMQDGQIRCGSRNNDLIEKSNPFNGFVEWVNNSDAVKSFFKDYPDHRLYGEWLVKHTIQYDETAYQEFYLFDVMQDDKFWHQSDVACIASHHGFSYPRIFAVLDNPTIEQLVEHVGKSFIGSVGEGVVIKNPEFVNKFGDHQYGKIVTESFKEENAISFGGNNKHSESYWEMYIAQKYVTVARLKKIIQKYESEFGKCGLKETPRIAGMAYHDMLTEEIWEISKKVQDVNFKSLKRICMKKAISIYKDILNNSISVGHE